MGSKLPEDSRLSAALAAAAVLGFAAFFPVWTNDTFGHLAAGRQIWQLGRVPGHDTFSFYFDSPQPWRNANWATGLLLWLLFDLGGAPLLVATKVAVIAAVAVVLVRTCYRHQLAPWLCALFYLWAIPALRIRFSVRPHLFGLLACAVLFERLLYLARREDEDPRLPWGTLGLLCALQIAWTNLHGSGPLGFLVTGAFLVGHLGDPKRQRVYGAVLAALVLGSCVSPWGPAIMLETVMHIGSEGTRWFIGEWTPLAQRGDGWDIAIFLAALGLLAWSIAPLWRAGPPGRSSLLMVLGMLIMAGRSTRFIDLALLFGAPVVAEGVATRLHPWARRPGLRLALPAVGLLGLLWLPSVAEDRKPYQQPGWGISVRNLPAAPGRWLARHRPRARIAALMEDSWYLSFAVPKSRVLIDGRQSVYPLDVLQRVSGDLAEPARLLALAEEKGVDAIVLRHNRPEHAASIAMLAKHPGFGLATIGDRHLLFVRGLPRERSIEVLAPNLAIRVFGPDERERARAEIGRIGEGPGAEAYLGLQRALLRLSPYLRDNGTDGLAPATDPERRESYRQALQDLVPALERNMNLSTAQILAAMIGIRLCRLAEAERALRIARAEGENRLTIALGIALAIQRGQPERAGRMLSEIDVDPTRDRWLSELRHELGAPAACE